MKHVFQVVRTPQHWSTATRSASAAGVAAFIVPLVAAAVGKPSCRRCW